MKIKVAEEIAVEVKITCTMSCPAGSAYHTIDYLIDGMCIHSATTGAIYGEPNPIAMLDRKFTRQEEHYTDIPREDMPTGEDAKGRELSWGTCGDKKAWFEKFTLTHRQAIIEAAAQIVED